ncbi:MAG TPA: Uma2 family endonuclease [Blastocatellia bacterium]|nr:Uma2 family endonuclease [Blastocatellia bacterium]
MALPESNVPTVLLTEEEYLEMERKSEERHLYLDGYVYAMAGETLAHGDICTNIIGTLFSQLRDSPCRVLSKDMKVRSGPIPTARRTKKGMFSYPDIIVVCGTPVFHDHHRDVLLNPTVIIEVLSDSTEAFDRGQKFLRYRNYLESLSEYILISQNTAHIDHFQRRGNKGWFLQTFFSLEDTFTIPAINCSLKLSDVYARVTFPPPKDEFEEDDE